MNMRYFLLYAFLILSHLLPAQTYSEYLQFEALLDVRDGSVAMADVNGDNLLDVLITGQTNFTASVELIARLYINVGGGILREKVGTPFEAVNVSSLAFADVNGDQHPDLLITGLSKSAQEVANLYINDGAGNFSHNDSTPIKGVAWSSVNFADLDGDNDQDLLIVGDGPLECIAELYINDGMGNFTPKTGTPFEGAAWGSTAIADVNGDTYPDVLISGIRLSIPDHITKLYTNDGAGNFTEVMGTPFEAVGRGSVSFADVNGDSYQDLLITGQTNQEDPNDYTYVEPVSKLYTNDGAGNFTEMMGTPFEPVTQSSAAFVDINGDSYQDVLITGLDSSYSPITRLYSNDGSGNYSEISPLPFDGNGNHFYRGSIGIGDMNGDNAPDIMLTGALSTSNWYSGETKLIINDGTGIFLEKKPNPIRSVNYSAVAFADVNGDTHQDLLVTGNSLPDGAISKLYINDGFGNFSQKTRTPFEGVASGSIAFADVNGNGHQDVFILGYTGSDDFAVLYTNDGIGNFTEKTGTPFNDVYHGSVAFADVNGDNTQDILITGAILGTPNKISSLYTNDGAGNFTEVMGTPFEEVRSSSIAFADVNGDTYPDVLITGEGSANSQISRLYTNDGAGNFTEMTGTPFEPVSSGSIAFADVNGDSYQDVLITGESSGNSQISKLYTNDGAGNFTEMMGTPFEGVQYSSVAFFDANNDSFLDVLITGKNGPGYGIKIAKLYTNDGTGNFTEVIGTPFDAVDRSSIAIADVNGDNRMDVFVSGATGLNRSVSKLYTFISDWPTGIDEFILPESKLLDLSLFPNPVSEDQVFITYNSSDNGLVKASIYDLNGRVFIQQTSLTAIGEQHLSIDISSLTPGLYLIQLEEGEKRGVARLVVE